MDGLRGMWLKVRAVLRPGAAERDIQDELRFHVDMEAERLTAEGHAPHDAARAARVAFGGVERWREATRDARGTRWLEEAARDLRVALRQLRRSPGFAVVAVLTLALGIGANTAIFSVVDGVLLRPLPYPGADRLLMVWETDRASGTTREPGSWPDFEDYRRDATRLAGLEAFMGVVPSLASPDGEPERLAGLYVTPGWFSLLGVQPLLGRDFGPDDAVAPGAPGSVILGEAFWRARFGADASVVGRVIRLDDVPHTVVGVVPDGADLGLDQVHERAAYHAPYASDGPVEVWIAFTTTEADAGRQTHPFLMAGRLAPGTSLGAAQEEMESLAARLEEAYPVNEARGVFLEPLPQVVFGPVRPALMILLGAVALVLLVACVNVANLLLARGAARGREVAVRRALGARTGRLGRQFLVETLLLTLAGGALGVLVAFGGLRALLAVAPPDIPRLDAATVDARVLLATLAVSLTVGLLFGLVPLAQARRVDVQSTLRQEGRGQSAGRARRRFRGALVVAELALSVTLVVAAGLLVRSFWTVYDQDPGFDAAGVVKAEYALPATRYPQDFARWPRWTEVHAFNAAVLERARALPGVQGAALAAIHPLDPGFANSFVVVGREAEASDWPELPVRQVSPDYFEVMGVALRAGRLLRGGDDADAAPVALVNQAMVDRFFPAGDPLGQEIRFWGVPRRVVGVVENELFHGLTEAPPPATYVPLAQNPRAGGVLLVRTAGDPTPLLRGVREAVWAGDRGVAVFGVEPMEETLRGSVAQRRFTMLLIAAFAGLALLLALIGVHGVLSYMVAERRSELGIRMALGASRGSVVALVVRGGAALAALGVGLGLLGALATSRLLAGLLFGVSVTDPLTYVVVPALVLSAATLATWLPARRITGIDPGTALRSG